jgi:hypothetical protein
MDLEENEARNDCAGEDRQQFKGQLRYSLETVVRRVGDWHEMAPSMQGREPRSRGTPTF